MSVLGEAVVDVVGNTKGFDKSVKDGVTKSANAAASSSGPLSKASKKMSGVLMKGLKTGLVSAGAGVGALAGTALFKGFSRLKGIDQAQSKLKGLGHDGKSVESIMKNATAAVTGTAFGLDEAATAAAGAVAAGVAPGKELEKTLTLVADASTIAGTDMGRMGAIFNKVAASNRLTMGTVSQLQTAGIPVLQNVAKEMGVTAEEAGKMVSKGEIEFSTFQKVMTKTLGGAAQESGKTFAGAMANTQAALGRLGASVLKGVFSKIPGVLIKVQGRLDKLGPYAEKAGNLLGDGFTAAGKLAAKHGPAIRKTLEDLGKRVQALGKAWTPVFKTVGSEIVNLGGILGKTFVPTLELALDVATAFGEAIDWLPDSIKKVGVQFGVAALIVPRLTAATTTLSASLTNAQTRARALSLELSRAQGPMAKSTVLMSRFGNVAKAAAGVGGMYALAEGAQRAGTATGFLLNTLGGAAVGSAFGPLGVLAGGAAGALTSVWQAVRKTNETSKDTAPLSNYAATLDEITGAASKATSELIYLDLQESGAIKNATSLGVSHRDLVKSVMGNEKAFKRVRTAMVENGKTSEDLKNVFGDLASILPEFNADYRELDKILFNTSSAFAEDVKQTKLKALAVGDLKKVLKGIRPEVKTEVITELKNRNFKVGLAEINEISEAQGLVKPEVRVLMRALNVKGVVREVDGVAQAFNNVAETKVDGRQWKNGLKNLLTEGKRETNRGANGIQDNLAKSTNVRPSNRFTHDLNSILSGAKGTAYSGGSDIGANLKAGLESGFGGAGIALSAAMTSAVNQAIAAGKRAARENSPSKRTMESGKNLALGYAIGITKNTPAMVTATRKAVDSMAKALPGKSKGTKVQKAFQEYLTGGDLTKGMRKVLGKKLSKAVNQIDNQIDRAHKKLLNRVSKRNDLAKSINESLAFDLSTVFEPNEYGFKDTSFAGVSGAVRSMATKARNFASLVKKMAKRGIPRGLIEQIIGLGFDQGTEVAKSMLSASNAEVKQLRSDWSVMQNNISAVGNTAANQFFQTGIKAQEGLIKGLLKKDPIKKASQKLAKNLTKELKKALKIKSPSRLLAKEIGLPSGEGIGEGTVDGVKALGPQVREATLKAFTVPGRPLTPIAASPAPQAPVSEASAGAATPMLLDIDYEALAQALSNIQQQLVINRRQAGILVQTGLSTIEGQG